MKKGAVWSFVRDLWRIYTTKHISRSAAELSYFLTLSVFPTVMCMYALFGNTIPTRDLIFWAFADVVPTDALEAIMAHLAYVQANSGRAMLIGGGTLMLTSSGAAFRALHNIMAEIQGAPKYRGGLFVVISLLFSLVLLAVMYFAALVILAGEWLLDGFSQRLPWVWDWSRLRFVLLFALLLLLVLGAYSLVSPEGKRQELLPGAIVAAFAMVGVGMMFSTAVSYSVRYSMVYGSLASMVILMLSLYIFGNILILGCAVNHMLKNKKHPPR